MTQTVNVRRDISAVSASTLASTQSAQARGEEGGASAEADLCLGDCLAISRNRSSPTFLPSLLPTLALDEWEPKGVREGGDAWDPGGVRERGVPGGERPREE